MSRPVADGFDQALALPGRPQDLLHYLDIRQRPVAPDVVDLTRAAVFEQRGQSAAVVFDEQPIPNLHSVAVDRKPAAVESVENHERDQLLGELIGAVVVRRPGHQHGQPIGGEVGKCQQVRARLRRRVRAAGLQRKSLVRHRRLGQAAIHLVGRDVQETPGVVGARRFEQRERASQIGLEDRLRRQDAAVHVRFGGEVDDGVGRKLVQQGVHQRRVANVAVHEAIPRIGRHRLQVLEVPGVGELVQIDQGANAILRKHQADERRSDEPRAAGNQQSHLSSTPNAARHPRDAQAPKRTPPAVTCVASPSRS